MSVIGTKILERIEAENERAAAADARAKIDYNIMMGTLEDPSESEEGEEDE